MLLVRDWEYMTDRRNIYYFSECFYCLGSFPGADNYMGQRTVYLNIVPELTWRRDVPQVDLYALWWKSAPTNGSAQQVLGFLTNSTGGNSSLIQFSSLIASSGIPLSHFATDHSVHFGPHLGGPSAIRGTHELLYYGANGHRRPFRLSYRRCLHQERSRRYARIHHL